MACRVAGEGEALYEIKRSKFHSFAVPVAAFDEKLAWLRKTHPKARHFVWAYRRIENDVPFEKQSDDGEPAGTGGRPTLNVLQKQNIVEGAIITVRYFGGIKLGASGLVKAYTKAAVLALGSADVETIEEYEKFLCGVAFGEHARVVHILKKMGFGYKEIFLDDGVKLEIDVPVSGKETFLSRFGSNILRFEGGS